VLVTRQAGASGAIFLSGDDEDPSFEIDHKSDATWLDEVGAPGGSATHHRRTFLEYQNTENARIADPGLEGVCLTIAVIGEEVNVEPRAPRRISASVRDKNRRSASAIGLYAELPETVTMGKSFPFSSEGIIALLVDLDGAVGGLSSELTLDRVDDETRRGFLSGPLKFSTKVDRMGLSATSTYEGKLLMEIDLEKHTIVSAKYAGVSKVEGRGTSAGKVTGSVRFTCAITAKTVTSISDYKEKMKRPVFRENTHRMAGAEFKLPSCWIGAPTKEAGMTVFFDSRTEDSAAIEVLRGEVAADPSADGFIEAFVRAARKEAVEVKTKKATFPTGDGFTFDFSTTSRANGRGFVAPVAKGLLRVRVVGSADAVKKASPDLRLMQGSIADSAE
jgi:hypothetical protein